MKLKECIHDAHDLDYEVNGLTAPFVVSNGETGVVVFTDDMEFHRNHYSDELEELGYITESGATMGLTPKASRVMASIVEHEAGLARGTVSIDEVNGGDYSYLEYAYELPPKALEMDVDGEELFDLCWDFLAACVNVTDPGTFGSPYIITEAARNLV